MKKTLICLIIVLAGSQITFAQDINSVIAYFEKTCNSDHQVVNKAMLNSSFEAAAAADPTGQLKSNTPPFMHKIDSIEVFSLEGFSLETKNQLLDKMNSFEDGNGYESLIRVKEDGENVRIVANKNGDIISEILVFSIEQDEIVFVRMSVNMDESDLNDFISEQNNNYKKE
ncbi:DUF4252 domain-containing protein [Dysgonomonas sp. ZJ709]|uniref:DUF4252 domain-containing protein n=1 Tax=Dysgonomonas sp. ZJ709 TaxID=2709797 RepID=UPI0013EB9257|nr:DUF4252 domain-containing protein [Dysgonomonas sp. ZJ709]